MELAHLIRSDVWVVPEEMIGVVLAILVVEDAVPIFDGAPELGSGEGCEDADLIEVEVHPPQLQDVIFHAIDGVVLVADDVEAHGSAEAFLEMGY